MSETLFWIVVAMFVLAVFVSAVAAAEKIRGPVTADVVRIVDGDTLIVNARPWPSLSVQISVRVDGVDTPELRGKCPEERALAKMARDMTVADIGTEPVTLRNIRYGKFAGRVLADIETASGDLREMLLGADVARPYYGGKRAGWCDGRD